MKYCIRCGKELFDEAVLCVGCGCLIKGRMIEDKKKTSTFVRNKKQWVIVFAIIFVIFTSVTVMLLTSNDFIRTNDYYRYLHSDAGQFGNTLREKYEMQWQKRVEITRDKLIPYYAGIGVCGVVSLTSLVCDIVLLSIKNKDK